VRKQLEIISVSRISEVIEGGLEVLVANPPPPLTADARITLEPDTEPVAARQL